MDDLMKLLAQIESGKFVGMPDQKIMNLTIFLLSARLVVLSEYFLTEAYATKREKKAALKKIALLSHRKQWSTWADMLHHSSEEQH